MNAHVFIDAENVPPEVGFKTVAKFRRDYTITKVDIIGKKENLSQKYLTAGEPYFVQNCYYGKNSADTWLCVEIAKTVFEENEVEAIIIVSSDRDFLPAVKLAAEKNKNVIMVSHGGGHNNLKKLFKELEINLDSVSLVDYRDGLNISDTKSVRRKKSLSELMQNASPTFLNPLEQKLKKFYRRLSPATEKFFRKREEQIKFIFVKIENSIQEIPFVDGMNVSTFTNVLHELKMVGKKSVIYQIIDDSLLLVSPDNKVHLPNFEEISVDFSEENISSRTEIENSVDENVAEKISEVEKVEEENFDAFENFQTIFINFGGELLEVPFFNGIDYKDFAEILSCFGIVGDSKFIKQIIFDSLLKISGGKIYLADDGEKIFSSTEFENLNSLSPEMQKFVSANENKIKFINLTYEGYFFEVPFMNGMTYAPAAKILLDLNVTDKFEDARKVFIGNGYKIINGAIYR